MNKRNNKKGFTITELVIVIVVIAILAAVLIPTFASLIKKANISADTQMAKNLNTALTMAEASGDKIDDFSDALDAMREAGYLLANMNPTADGCYLAWEKETNQVLLVELTEDSYKVLYKAKDGYDEPDDSWYFAVKDQATADAIKTVLGNEVHTELTILDTTALNTEINASGEQTIYIDGSIAVDEAGPIVLSNEDAKVTLDLGSSTISGNKNDSLSLENVPFRVTAGELTLNGGVIAATGDALDADGEVMNNVVNVNSAAVNIEGSKIEAPNSTITVALTNATANIKDATIIANDNVIQPSNGSKVVIENTTIECAWLAVYSSSSGGAASEVTIKSGTYKASQTTLLGVHGGVIICEDGTFSSATPEDRFFRFYNIDGGKIVLKGGTYNGIAFENLTKDILTGWVDSRQTMPSIDFVDGAWVLEIK